VIHLQPLTPDTLSAFEELLGSPEFGGCFCAVWTSFGDGSDWARRCSDPARPNLQEVRRRVDAGEHVGFLVRQDGFVVGWTGAGPKSGFPAMRTRLASRLSPADEGAWSIGCIALAAHARGAGLSRAIVAAVIAYATASGAISIEANPTRPWDEPRSYRGAAAVYADLGFEEVASEQDGGSEILLMRRQLS